MNKNSSAPQRAKLPPLPPFTIDRPRLFALIDANTHGAVWLHGPPGAGKTTLARSYARHANLSPLFVNMTREAVTLPGLFAALASSYQLAQISDASLPALEPGTSDRLEAFAEHFFDVLAQQAGGKAIVILDDLHRASSPEVFAAVTSGITCCAGRLMLLVSSQHLPDATFAEPLARGQLTILGRPQLALDEEEATALAAKLAGKLPGNQAAAVSLLASTGGWAAGLMLGLQYAGATSVPTDAAQEPTTALLGRYASSSLSPATVQALAVLRHLPTIPDAALSSHPQGDAVRDGLQRLANRGLFVELETAATGAQWRLHDLLREALAKAPMQTAGSEDVRAWADALASAGAPGAAARLLFAAKDDAGALAICNAHAEQIAAQDAAQLIALADGLRQRGLQMPQLSYCAARVAVRSDRTAADEWADAAYAQALEAGELSVALASVALMLIERADEFADTQGYEIWGERLEELAPRLEGISKADEFTLLTAQAALFQMRGKPDPQNIERLMTAVHEGVAKDADTWIEGARLCICSLISRAEIVRAYEFSQRTSTSSLFGNTSTSQLTKWLYHVGFARFHADEFLVARQLFEKARESAEQTGEPSLAALCSVALLRTHLELNELEEANQLGKKLEHGLAACSPWAQVVANLFLGRVALRSESYLSARNRLDRSLEVMTWACIPASRVPAWFVEKIQCHVALREFEQATELAGRYSALYSGAEALYGKALAEMARAFQYEAENDSRVYSALESGFAYAQQLGFKVFFRSLPKHASALCGIALERKIAVPFVRDVIKTRGLKAPDNATEQWPWKVWIQLLGGFQIVLDGSPLALSGKVAAKPLELIKLLASTRKMSLPQDAICAALWPDTCLTDLSAARKNLESTVGRARRLVGEDIIKVSDGRVSLDNGMVGSDVQSLNHLCSRSVVLQNRISANLDLSFHINRLQEAYKGELLPGEDTSPWSDAARQQVRNAFVQAVSGLSQVLSLGQRNADAIGLLEQAVGREPLAEELYGQLMKAYMAEGRRAEALHTYRRCKQFLSLILGMSPSSQTEQIKAELLL
ncbi:MAG: BTAD domain-containing putative transcriptional regulator [Burkholderiaceae bacterium]